MCENNRPCRIFLCYRHNTAHYAINVKDAMDNDKNHKYGYVWYSQLEIDNNFLDNVEISDVIAEAEWIVFFVGSEFTTGFLNPDGTMNSNCSTAREFVAIEKERQKRKAVGQKLNLLQVNIDQSRIDKKCAEDLLHLFYSQGILANDSVTAYQGMSLNPFLGDSTSARVFVEQIIAKRCAKDTKSASIVANQESESSGIGDKVNRTSDARIVQTNGSLQKPKHQKKGTFLLCGTYPQTYNGETKPIEWIILENDSIKSLLISRYTIDCQPFNSVAGSVTWAESSLRSWLNDVFFNMAFSNEERSLILDRSTLAEKNPLYKTAPGINTTDKVSLLSLFETIQFFPVDSARCCMPTDYARKRMSITMGDQTVDANSQYSWWWLRSPGGNPNYASGVYSNGALARGGYLVENGAGGVRPVILLKTSDDN